MKHLHRSLTTSTVEMSIQKPTKQSTKKNESITRNIEAATIKKMQKLMFNCMRFILHRFNAVVSGGSVGYEKYPESLVKKGREKNCLKH